MSSLFKSKPKTTTETSETTKTLPPWLQTEYTNLLAKANSAAGMGLTPEEQSAIDLITGSIQGYQGYQDQAIGATQSVLDKALGGGPTTADIEAGMNPYLQSVLDRQRRESEKSYYSGLSQLQDQEQAAGAFGGSRSAVAQQTLQDNYADNLDKIMNEGLFNAFETSRNQYNLNTQNTLGSAINLSNLGQAGQAGVLTSANALGQAGAMPRNIEQGNVSLLNSVISPAAQTMVGQNGTSTQTQSGGGGSLFSQLLGAGLSIAGMASGIPGGSMLGGLFGTAAGTPLANAAGPTQGSGLLGMFTGGKFASGGLVDNNMPDYIRNAPDLSWEEKMQAWDAERSTQAAQMRDRAAADREWNMENIPMSAPGMEDGYSIDMDPTGSYIMEKVINDMVAPNTKSDKNLIERGLFGKGSMTDTQLKAVKQRHPSLEKYLARIDSMSPQEMEEIFTMDEGDLRKRRASTGDNTLKFATGGLIDPANMSAEEEEMYWRNRRPSLAQVLSMKSNTKAPQGDAVYLRGSGPKNMDAFGREVEANSDKMWQDANREKLLSIGRGVVSGVEQADKDMDAWRAPVDTKGMSRLEGVLAKGAALPRQAMGLAGEATLMIPKAGINVGEWLASNPDAEKAQRQMADLKSRAQMTSEERRIQDLIDAGIDPSVAPALAPTEKVGEVTTKSGKTIPVEAPKKPSAKEVEKALVAEEAKPQEEQGMNVPLIMAGIALLTSKDDAFEAMGQGLAAYLSGKDMIKQEKKADAKEKRQEALAERAMQVEEGKLGIMKEQLGLDAQKIAIAAKEAGNNGIKAKDIQDGIADRFGKILDAKVDAVQPGQEIDMNSLINESYSQAVSLYRGEVAPVSSPLQQLLAATQAAKAKQQ